MTGLLRGLLALAMTSAGIAFAQGTPPPAGPAVAPRIGNEVLKGIWTRPDGGYTIVIKNSTTGGELDAMYYNPNPLPFSKAQALQDGATLRVFFELRAGGYNGSTYELIYDPSADRLKGTYYQAVAKQRFDVYFARR